MDISNGVNKQIIIAVSVFLTFIIIGATIYFGINYSPNNINGQSGNQAKEISENTFLPVKKLNCEDIIDAKEKENCQAEVVNLLNSENGSVCESLETDADKNACRQTYIIKEAVSSGDLKKCDEINDEALSSDCSAQASFSLAIQKKDKKYCENIINKTDKENCLRILTDMGVK